MNRQYPRARRSTFASRSPGGAEGGTSGMKRRVTPSGPSGGSPGSDVGTGLAARAFRAPSDLPWPLAAALIAAGLVLAWAVSYLAGREDRVPPHLFYVPILLAAVRSGLRGAVRTALTSGLVADPLLPDGVGGAIRRGEQKPWWSSQRPRRTPHRTLAGRPEVSTQGGGA